MRWPAPRLIGFRPLPVFTMELFTTLFGNLLAFVYHCFDRIVIHGYLSALSRPEQVVHFFRQVLGIPVVSKEILSQRTADYQNWVEAFARNHHTPIGWAEKGVRKEDHVLPWQRRMTKNNAYGVYYIFKSMEQGPTFRISMPKYPTKDPHYRIHQRSRFTHYYFYIRDEVLGPMVADPLADDVGMPAKPWSEWQDLNLRPPRPERGALPATAHFACGLSPARCWPPPSAWWRWIT